MSEEESTFSKTLVLNVDRDGDVELKTSRKTPIIGKEEALDIARELLLADPEEADGNAIYASIKIFDQIEGRSHEDKQIAIISGSKKGGVEADRKIIRELREVLSKFPADNVILVTDGFSDEQIIPIISSFVKISSIQRIVVKHSEKVEETYALLLRYLRMAWEEPPYRIYFIGVPGIALVIIGFLLALGLLQLAGEIILIILGCAFAIKGFGIDEYLSSLKKAPSIDLLRFFSTLASIIFVISGVYVSYLNISSLPEYLAVMSDNSLAFTYGAYLTGKFLESFIPIFTAGALVYVFGGTLYDVFTEAGKLFRDLMIAISVFVFYFIGKELAGILVNPSKGISSLTTYVLAGVVIIFVVSSVMYLTLKRRD